MKSLIQPFKNGFTKAEFPNTFVNLIAPLISYTFIPIVTKLKLKQSNINDREKDIVVAQEIPKQAINGLIAICTFLTGKRLGPGLLKLTGLGNKLSSEGATLVATGLLNLAAYTFIRPWLSLEIFDQWFDRQYQGRHKQLPRPKSNLERLPLNRVSQTQRQLTNTVKPHSSYPTSYARNYQLHPVYRS